MRNIDTRKSIEVEFFLVEVVVVEVVVVEEVVLVV
jgi:hypothetical protein